MGRLRAGTGRGLRAGPDGRPSDRQASLPERYLGVTGRWLRFRDGRGVAARVRATPQVTGGAGTERRRMAPGVPERAGSCLSVQIRGDLGAEGPPILPQRRRRQAGVCPDTSGRRHRAGGCLEPGRPDPNADEPPQPALSARSRGGRGAGRRPGLGQGDPDGYARLVRRAGLWADRRKVRDRSKDHCHAAAARHRVGKAVKTLAS